VLLRWTFSGLAGTLGAIAFSTPVAAAHFGAVSIVSPLTNLLCLWCVSLLFNAGWLALIAFMALPMVGRALALCLVWLGRYVFLVVRVLAGLPYTVVYTSNPLIACWMVFAYAVFIAAFLLRDRKRPFRPLMPACLSLIGLCAVILLTIRTASDSLLIFTALDVGQGQCVVMQAGSATVMVDCGGTNSEEGAGDKAAGYLLGRSRQRLDLLILTHLHDDHANGAVRLMSEVEVRCLLLPREADDEKGLLPEILEAAKRRGTDVQYVTEDMSLEVGELSLSVFAPMGEGGDNERGLIVLAGAGDFEALITGDADSETERQLTARGLLPDIELLMVGHHGSRYSTGGILLDAARPETAVISVGWNSYGHPAEETMERLTGRGIDIHRTDVEGDVVVRVPKEGS
jgi:competence protein ComEC